MNIHVLAVSTGPFTNMNMDQITTAVGELDQKHKTMRKKALNKLFDSLPINLYNLAKQSKIGQKEWEAFDKKMALLPLKALMCEDQLERIHEMEQAASKHFQCIPRDLQPIVLSFPKKYKETAKVESNEKPEKAEKVEKRETMSLLEDLEPETWTDELVPLSCLPQAMEAFLGGGQEGKERRIEFPKLDDAAAAVLMQLLKTGTMPANSIDKSNVSQLFHMAMQYDLKKLQQACAEYVCCLYNTQDELGPQLYGAVECYTAFVDLPPDDSVVAMLVSHILMFESRTQRILTEYWETKLQGPFSAQTVAAYMAAAKHEAATLPRSKERLQNIIIGGLQQRIQLSREFESIESFFDACMRPYLGKPGYDFLQPLLHDYFYKATAEWRKTVSTSSYGYPIIVESHLLARRNFSILQEVQKLNLCPFISSVVIRSTFDYELMKPDFGQHLCPSDAENVRRDLESIFPKNVTDYNHVPKKINIILSHDVETTIAKPKNATISPELNEQIQAIWKAFLKERGLEEKLAGYSIECKDQQWFDDLK